MKDSILKEIEDHIYDLVDEIQRKVSSVPPINLMNYIVTMSNLAMSNKISEIEYSEDEIFTTRAVEYVQSVLVSCDINHEDGNEVDETEYADILSLVIELYKKTTIFLMAWTQEKIRCGEMSDEEVQYIIEDSINRFVRGDRYQKFQIPYFNALLRPQEEVLKKVFGITHECLMSGLEMLEYNLSRGWSDTFNELQTIDFEDLVQRQENEQIEKTNKLMKNLLFLGLCEVEDITDWPEELINALTFEAGGKTDFYDYKDFKGLPLRRLPAQEKPFIKIDNTVYCFSHYLLFDNFYRCIQKAVLNAGKEYKEIWQKNQKKASEQIVEELFHKLLPGATIYRDNYYPKNESLKNLYENDLIIVCQDVLIIVEVKAGAFTYTPAITDYESHIKSFKDIVNAANNQCARTLLYLENKNSAPIYDENKTEKARIDINQYTQKYTFCVTLDGFNEFAAKAEKVSLIRIEQGTIVISIDDLWVYAEYFNEPYEFIHYLKQRSQATKVNSFLPNDELDHLGLYIEHNMYWLTMQNEDADAIFVNGYREGLDNYFGSYGKNLSRPEQEMEKEFRDILKVAQSGNVANPFEFTNFLQDFSKEAKAEFVESLKHVSQRQKITRQMIPISTFGDVRYCLFVETENVNRWDEQRKINYVYSLLIETSAEWYYMITVNLSKTDSVVGVEYYKVLNREVPFEKKDDFQETINRIKSYKIEAYRKKTGRKKIGRNEPCPCGSGRKYKHCCGK